MSDLFRKRLNGKKLIRSIGAYDTLSAVMAERSGMEAIFAGGFGVTASRLGEPDLGLLTLSEMADAVRRMASRVKIPVIADGDTGFGGVHNVVRAVREFETGGAQGIVLEDQVSPKRCGHFDGKHVISASDMTVKLRAALAARVSKNFLIFARTDARDTHGIGEAVRRGNLYRKAGADVVFVESPATVAELREIPRKIKAPVLVNMLTGGKTPNLPASELESMGYAIVVYPIESLLITAAAIGRLAKTIMADGSVDAVRDEMMTFQGIKEVVHGSR